MNFYVCEVLLLISVHFLLYYLLFMHLYINCSFYITNMNSTYHTKCFCWEKKNLSILISLSQNFMTNFLDFCKASHPNTTGHPWYCSNTFFHTNYFLSYSCKNSLFFFPKKKCSFSFSREHFTCSNLQKINQSIYTYLHCGLLQILFLS